MKGKTALLTVAGALMAGGILFAQGKKSEPMNYPGIMEFRCQASDFACPSLETPDRALGNGNESKYVFLPDGSAGAGIYRTITNGSHPGSNEAHFNPGVET